MKIGYARVSSKDQDCAIQIAALTAAGCEKVFHEKMSGRQAESRLALNEALEFCRNGDVLHITRLDRLARNLRDLHNIAASLEAKGVGLICVSQSGVDTTTPTGKLMFSILGAVAEFEADIIHERQAEGIIKAKAEGKYKGRGASLDYAEIKKLHKKGINPTDIASLLKVGRSSVYRALKAA